MSQSQSPRPNILLITTDQQRADALGINSTGPLQTPNLDHMAARGVNFTRGYSTCPVCIPARRSLLTGIHPANHGLRKYQDGLDWDPPFTLPGLLSRAGYQTELLGKLHLHPQRKRYGFDHMVRSETENYRPTSKIQSTNDYATWLKNKGVNTHPAAHGISGNGRLARPHILEEAHHHNSWLTQEAIQFLTDTRDTTCPWFLHLSFFTPHPPLTPPQTYFDRYQRIADRMPTPNIGEWVPQWDSVPKGKAPDDAFGPFDPEIIQNAWVGYYGLINHIDDCVAHVLERYFEYGSDRQNDPVWIIFTSDHGEMLGDHQLFRKSLPYESACHVPFFIAGRNVEITPGTCDALACLEDVAPTVMDLAGLEPPEEMVSGVNGRSLAGAVRGEACAPREALFTECGGYQANYNSVIFGRWKYVWFIRDNEEQLFDLQEDPQEMRDVSGNSAALAPMRELMAEHMQTREHATYNPAQLRPLENTPPATLWPGRKG